VVVTPSGLRVKVHVPVLGKPTNTTLPNVSVQDGCAIGPTVGRGGLPIGALITTLAEAKDVQPVELLTENV
jgi:hypothetical protein